VAVPETTTALVGASLQNHQRREWKLVAEGVFSFVLNGSEVQQGFVNSSAFLYRPLFKNSRYRIAENI
jgi:hypothetical protein